MAQSSNWRERLEGLKGQTAAFVSEHGRDLYGASFGQHAAGLATFAVTAAAVVGTSLVVAGSGEQYGMIQPVVSDALVAAGVLGGPVAGALTAQKVEDALASAPRGATLDGDNHSPDQQALRVRVGELFRALDDNPDARARLVEVLRTDEGQQVFLAAAEASESDPESVVNAAAATLERFGQSPSLDAHDDPDDTPDTPSPG